MRTKKRKEAVSKTSFSKYKTGAKIMTEEEQEIESLKEEAKESLNKTKEIVSETKRLFCL